MYSFRDIAWSLTLNFEIFGPFISISAIFFMLRIIFSKCHYSYMIVYIKSHNYDNHNNTRGEGGCKSPKSHLIFRSNFLAKPEQTNCQRYTELKYWTYIFIFWNKTHGYLFRFFSNWLWILSSTYIILKCREKCKKIIKKIVNISWKYCFFL